MPARRRSPFAARGSFALVALLASLLPACEPLDRVQALARSWLPRATHATDEGADRAGRLHEHTCGARDDLAAGVTPAVAGEHVSSLAGERSDLWPNGSVLDVYFLDGSAGTMAAVERIAAEWSEHANIRFRFHGRSRPAQPEIAISFRGRGYWSIIGNRSAYAARAGRTSLQLGGLDGAERGRASTLRRVVLHELGHALGMMHEHQSPRAEIAWNEPVVYDYYARTHGWSRATVRSNVLERSRARDAFASPFDPDSIMMYPVPRGFTTNGFSQGWNGDLSAADRSYIAQIYPGHARPPEPEPTPATSPLDRITVVATAPRRARHRGRVVLQWELRLDGPAAALARIRDVRYVVEGQRGRGRGDGRRAGFPITAVSSAPITVLVEARTGDGQRVRRRIALSATRASSCNS